MRTSAREHKRGCVGIGMRSRTGNNTGVPTLRRTLDDASGAIGSEAADWLRGVRCAYERSYSSRVMVMAVSIHSCGHFMRRKYSVLYWGWRTTTGLRTGIGCCAVRTHGNTVDVIVVSARVIPIERALCEDK